MYNWTYPKIYSVENKDLQTRDFFIEQAWDNGKVAGYWIGYMMPYQGTAVDLGDVLATEEEARKELAPFMNEWRASRAT